MLDLQAILEKIYSNLPAIVRNLTCSIPSKWWSSLYLNTSGVRELTTLKRAYSTVRRQMWKALFTIYIWSQSLPPCIFFTFTPYVQREKKKASSGYRSSFVQGNWFLSITLFSKTSFISNHCVGEWGSWAQWTLQTLAMGLTLKRLYLVQRIKFLPNPEN